MREDNALSQVVDLELKDRSAVEIACAYRALCCSLLLRTAMAARAKTPPRKVEIDQKQTAIKWTTGSVGLITFEEACDALDLQPDQARDAISAYASKGAAGSINRGRPRSRTTFRRTNVSRPPDVVPAAVPTAPRMAPRNPDASANRLHPGWTRTGSSSGAAS